MGAMSASIKIKDSRKGSRKGSCSRRKEPSRKESNDFDSYHSHHHLVGEKPDIQTKKEARIPTSDSRISIDDSFLKSVVFTSKTESKTRPDSPRKQITACRTKTSSQERKPSKRKPQCSSKLIQTSSSISKTVSHRSVAVGVSDIDIKVLEKYQSKPISKSLRRLSPQTPRRRARPPGSSITINSGGSRPHSRAESSVMAALEAPLASFRHSRCMADHSYSAPPKTVSPLKKKKKSKVQSAGNKRKTKAPDASGSTS